MQDVQRLADVAAQVAHGSLGLVGDAAGGLGHSVRHLQAHSKTNISAGWSKLELQLDALLCLC